MLLKTILFALIFIFLVRAISRLFGPGGSKKNSKFKFFYQAFKNVRQQQKQQQEQKKRNPSRNGHIDKGSLDNIEEAEYEEVTEEGDSKSGPSTSAGSKWPFFNFIVIPNRIRG